ncbi:MAG TPA: N-acetylmuramic acid 6-phosphate etherase [Polyangia bacterium]
MARSQSPKDDGSGQNDAENPRASMLDTLPTEDVIKLLVDEESGAIKVVRARAAALALGAQLMADKLAAGGRLIFVGSGTAGRMGALEAAECVPAFALPPSLVVSIVAGGPSGLSRVAEAAQDNSREADQRMRRAAVGPQDVVCAITDSEISPFLQAALDYARFRRAGIVLLSCANPVTSVQASPMADVVVDLAPGPEIIAGCTRLKTGTAIKLALQSMTSAAFVRLGKTYGGLMVDVRPTTPRSWQRATRVVTRLTKLSSDEAVKLIKKAGGRAKVALVMHHARVNAARAKELIVQNKGSLRAILGDLDLFG